MAHLLALAVGDQCCIKSSTWLGMHSISVRCIGIIQLESFLFVLIAVQLLEAEAAYSFTSTKQLIISLSITVQHCPLFHWPWFWKYVEVPIGILSFC